MILRVLVLIASIISLCSGHNRLISPTPWSPSPTKYPPCGSGIPLTVPQAYWYAGSLAEIEWMVIGDGQGPLNISIDPMGGTAFTKTVLSSTPTLAMGANYFNFTVPDITCTGINNTCSVQVFSQDGWVACTSISILPACVNCTPVAPPRPTCTKVTGLNFCSEFNDTYVRVGAGFNAAALDLMVNESLVEYTYSMTTFANGTTPACQKAFKDYLCASIFPSCEGVISSCQAKCDSFKQICGMVESHYNLYNCSALSSCPTNKKKIPYQKIIIFSGIAIVAVIVGAFIVRFVICKKKSGYTAING